MKKLFKKAENYGSGSKGSGYNDTAEGSDTSQLQIDNDSASNGDGQGKVPKGGFVNHPVTPFGEQGHYSDNIDGTSPYKVDGASPFRPPNSKENQHPDVAELPYPQQAVDENHADNVTAYRKNNIFSLVKKAKDNEADFFTSNVSGGAADSPQNMEDGLIPNELTIEMLTRNNPTTPTGQAGYTSVQDEGTISDWKDNSPQIEKGIRSANKKQQLFITHLSFGTDKQELTDSNVYDIMNPDEIDNKNFHNTHDFGDGVSMFDDRRMIDAPLEGGVASGNEEASTYGGVDNTANFKNMYDLVKKSQLKKKAIGYNQLLPSQNPNSGPDEEPHSYSGGPAPVMSDGKNAADALNHADDKTMDDPTEYRKKIRYQDKTEDTDSFYNLLNTGGGFGGEGDGANQSGVNNC